VSRSALRAWYRNGDIASRLVDGPHGPQRLVPLQAVLDRAAQSARIQRRAEREVSLEAQVTLLRHRVDQLELRLAALRHSDARRGSPKYPAELDELGSRTARMNPE
jgi:hypothetical protein